MFRANIDGKTLSVDLEGLKGLNFVTNGDTINAFSRTARGRTLTFRMKAGSTDMMDKETSSTWTPYGECTGGQLKGTKLARFTPLPSFWFSWAQFFPQTEVYSVK